MLTYAFIKNEKIGVHSITFIEAENTFDVHKDLFIAAFIDCRVGYGHVIKLFMSHDV